MKKGFTLVELLTVLAIIVLLLGLIVPSTSTIRRYAKKTKQTVQLTTIGLGLTTFRNDDGEYPPSNCDFPQNYCGAQKLAEAILGWDLLGFHPDSIWDAAGTAYNALDEVNRYERRRPYLELGTSYAFRLGQTAEYDGLFANASEVLDPSRFVLCDVFGVRQITLPDGDIARAGTPILYYRANTSSRRFDVISPNTSIYDLDDNSRLLSLGMLKGPMRVHALYNLTTFYNYLEDPSASTSGIAWPYKPDSYILISAGADGQYGTPDDITNF